MKKMKRLFAVLLTLAMVLGMSVMTFAAQATVTVDGAVAGTEYQYLQLIKPDTNKETGWAFATDAIAADFRTALSVTDDQTAIWMLIGNADTKGEVELPAGITAATGEQVEAAVKAVANAAYTPNALSAVATSVVVSDAGMYYIRATAPAYTYNPIAAYVSFGYNGNGSLNGELNPATVNAKGTAIDTGKTSDQEKQVTEIGRTVTYYIKSIVPFVPLGNAERKYTLTDTITGANYIATDDGEITLSVYYGDEGITPDDLLKDVKDGTAGTPVPYVGTVTGSTFTADLSTVLDNNTHANHPIVITYQATVTDIKVGNNASIGDGTNNNQFGTDSDDLYTGKITIIKKDAADQNELSGAEFVISRTKSDSSVEYAKFTADGKLSGWTADKDEATRVVAGNATVQGLADGTYHIEETKAPAGYSINTDIEDVELTYAGDAATAEFSASRTVLDTQLSSLPSTGGIGTTIFTIAGCLIMIAAAGLFFVSRRKSAK